MTQLIINGIEAVLPQNFSVTVKRENSFFTKNGEYTYDATLNLDNPVNCQLYGFLHRLNKTDQIETERTATLIADGHVYCRGTEIVTRWTEDTVTIQIVSGESELNYFIGQDQKIEELDMGTVGDQDRVVYPLIRTKGGNYLNVQYTTVVENGWNIKYYSSKQTVPQPFLCDILNRLMTALGYTVGTNQLEDTQFNNLFLVNTVFTKSYARMIPGWTVKEFLEEVEKLTGVVFVTDNSNPEHLTCDILQKTQYYQNATQFTIRNVVDAYETEVEDDENRDADFSTSNVGYDLPDGQWKKLMKLPEELPEEIEEIEYPSLMDIAQHIKGTQNPRSAIYVDLSTGRKYIGVKREYFMDSTATVPMVTEIFVLEVDQFADVKHGETKSEIELKITPAPMAHARYSVGGREIIDLGSGELFWDLAGGLEEEEGEDVEEVSIMKDTIEETLLSLEENGGSERQDIYCAFFDGTYVRGANRQNGSFPMVYTDGYHASQMETFYEADSGYSTVYPVGSLRLQDLDETYFQGGYEIDTRHPVTIETYDPNVIDPRQVYVVRNKRFVCRDVEEVITPEGRQAKWKGTFYPIHITDESLEHRWVLTHGVWDDGGAWLDDGRWNDTDPD